MALDIEALERRLRARLAELAPPGAELTPELRAHIERGLQTAIDEELAAQGFDVSVVRAALAALQRAIPSKVPGR